MSRASDPARSARPPARPMAFAGVRTDTGLDLGDLADPGPLLLVFVRHAGCTFCGETLADLARVRAAGGPADGIPSVVVQMGTATQGRRLLDRHGLQDVHVVSDPERRLYAAMDLGRGSPMQLFGPRVWWRGALATLRGHFIGRLVGDGFQMPGAFLVRGGVVVRAFRHRDAAERTDFAGLCRIDGGAGVTSEVTAAPSDPAGS